jgi:hypothetical protein
MSTAGGLRVNPRLVFWVAASALLVGSEIAWRWRRARAYLS